MFNVRESAPLGSSEAFARQSSNHFSFQSLGGPLLYRRSYDHDVPKIVSWRLLRADWPRPPSGNLSAAITGPYTADANTLHLWHMDGAATPVPDSGSVSVPLNALANGATLGNPSFSGFGNAVNTFDGGTAATGTGTDAYIAPLTLVSGAGDNVNWSFSSAAGAFSYEAIVRFGYDPMLDLGPTAIGGTGRNAPLQIFNGDQDGVGGGVRSFQFRVDPVGFNPNSGTQVVPLTQPTLEFININNAVAPLQFVFAPIPIAGRCRSAGQLVSRGCHLQWRREHG